MRNFTALLHAVVVLVPGWASAAQIQAATCDLWDGEPFRADISVVVAPSAVGDTINSATMTGDMFTDDPLTFQHINVNCANLGNGNFRCQSSKTFSKLRTVTNVEYSITGQQTLAGAGNPSAFAINDQGVICN